MPDPDDNRNTYGLPAEPESGFARLKNDQDEFLELGGPGSIIGAVEIVPKTGQTEHDKGALINYTVSEDFTQTPGDYVLYITAVYENGIVRTEDRRYKVLDMVG
jgi:hypothetical protein